MFAEITHGSRTPSRHGMPLPRPLPRANDPSSPPQPPVVMSECHYPRMELSIIRPASDCYYDTIPDAELDPASVISATDPGYEVPV